MVAPLAAQATIARSEPGPLSAVLVTSGEHAVCAAGAGAFASRAGAACVTCGGTSTATAQIAASRQRSAVRQKRTLRARSSVELIMCCFHGWIVSDVYPPCLYRSLRKQLDANLTLIEGFFPPLPSRPQDFCHTCNFFLHNSRGACAARACAPSGRLPRLECSRSFGA